MKPYLLATVLFLSLFSSYTHAGVVYEVAYWSNSTARFVSAILVATASHIYLSDEISPGEKLDVDSYKLRYVNELQQWFIDIVVKGSRFAAPLCLNWVYRGVCQSGKDFFYLDSGRMP